MLERIKTFWRDEGGIDHTVAILITIIVSTLLIAMIYGSPSQGTGLAGGIKKAVGAEVNALGGN